MKALVCKCTLVGCTLALILVQWLTVFLYGSGCTATAPTQTGPPTLPQPVSVSLATVPAIPVNPALSAVIAGIFDSPDQAVGKQLEIIGYFRGWDLLQEASLSRPVTRSDWVLTDSSGSIYVTGLAPEGLDPSAQEDARLVIRVIGTVERQGDNLYLRAYSVERVMP